MRTRTPLVTAAVIAVLALAGCGTAAATSHAARTSAPASTSAPAAPASPQFTDPNGETCPAADSLGYCGDDDPNPPLACSTVIDPTGWSNGPLTENRAVAIVSAVLVTDGVNLTTGNASNTDLRLLDGETTAMANFSGSQLATDASQFVSDEQSFNPGQTDFGPTDTSYATAMEGDILTLVKDCPGSAALRTQMTSS
jgi:hypothetical protein